MKADSARSLVALLLWHLAGLVVAVAVTSQLFIGKSIVRMGSDEQLFLFTLGAAFTVAAGINTWWLWRRAGGWHVTRVLLLTVAAFGVGTLGLVLVQAPFVSRAMLVASIAVTTTVLVLSGWMRTPGLVTCGVLLLGLGIGMQAAQRATSAFLNRLLRDGPKPSRSVSVVDTRYVTLSATYYDNYFPNCDTTTGQCDYTPQTGGGIDGLAEGYLVATGEGLLHYVTRNAQGVLTVSRLPYRVPLNAADFATSGESAYGRGVFRVADILVDEHAGAAALYATHHYYKRTSDCVVLRLSVLRGSTAHIVGGTLPEQWKTLYETTPCMPRSSGPRNPLFHGEESGGRLARLDPSTLLMTVGDHQFDGFNSDTIAAQDLTSHYGKTMAIDLDRGTASVFTFGHRNPQGLYVTKSGEVWSTEHGPQGGDELNRLVRGANYGWPLVTYGTNYGEHVWPISLTPNDHRGFEEPVYSWVPSIAVSSLLVVEKDRFPYWQNDLLIGSFSASLIRARIRADRVVTLEHVRLRNRRARIRDLIEDRNGNIVLWFDDGPIAFLEPADSASAVTSQTKEARGQSLFAACTGCHAVADGATHGIGPDLAGIMDRPIADSDGFPYSPALAGLPGRWTEKVLDRFLADPQAFAPGNTMVFSGLADPADRSDLIAYLKAANRRAER